MAATAAVNRPPPAHPGPNGGNRHTRTNSGVTTSEQQDPGLHGTSGDPGLSTHPQPHISTRPVFYVPAPLPPPYLHHQWPMPFSYNPFMSFPGMGYGMVMPPFPPPPYMEPPSYILPHPHIQPVDHRLLRYRPVHAPNAPYQNPNHSQRVRAPCPVPVRETVNSEVQTEPTQRGGGYGEGSPLVGSDSGHGTASNSPSSSSSSSQKQGSAEGENYALPSNNAENIHAKRTSSTVTHGCNVLHPTGTKTLQSCIRASLERQMSRKDSVGQENVLPCRNGSYNIWSVSSSDSMAPVCSSTLQEDEVVKGRRVSVPDILLSWGGGTPPTPKMADKLPLNDHQVPSYEIEVEHDKSVNQGQTETKNGPVVADGADKDDAEDNFSSKDCATLFKILKLREAEERKAESTREKEPVGSVDSVRPCLPYKDELPNPLNQSHQLPDNEQEDGNETNLHEDTTDITPYPVSFNGCQITRKMNESIWSVESLAAFIPTKEWLLQNGLFEPQEIIEITGETENGGLSSQNDNLIVKASKERGQTDSVPMSDSCLIYSTPAEKLIPPKKPETLSETDVSDMRRPKKGQSKVPSESDPLASPTHLQSKLILSSSTEGEVNKNRSSEPEAGQSPNQESLIVNEQQVKSPCSLEQEKILLLNSAAGDEISSLQNGADVVLEGGACGNQEVGQLGNEQLCVPMGDQEMTKVSPSKVDCGIQCTEFQGLRCISEEMKSNMEPDMKNSSNGQADGFNMKEHMQKNQKRHGPRRNKSQEKYNSQPEAYNGYCGKPGKSQGLGRNGRNQRY